MSHRKSPIAWTPIICLVAMLIMSLTPSCKQQDVLCYEPTEATMRVGFGQRLILDVDTFLDSVLVDTTLFMYRDTLLPYLQAIYDDGSNKFNVISGEGTNSLTLLLNPNASSTRYAVTYDTTSGIVDTLIVNYNTVPVFISNDCGFTNFYNIEDVMMVSSGVDSMHISDIEVTLDNSNNKRHVYFYFFND